MIAIIKASKTMDPARICKELGSWHHKISTVLAIPKSQSINWAYAYERNVVVFHLDTEQYGESAILRAHSNMLKNADHLFIFTGGNNKLIESAYINDVNVHFRI
jgi:hypothetical protein